MTTLHDEIEALVSPALPCPGSLHAYRRDLPAMLGYVDALEALYEAVLDAACVETPQGVQAACEAVDAGRKAWSAIQ